MKYLSVAFGGFPYRLATTTLSKFAVTGLRALSKLAESATRVRGLTRVRRLAASVGACFAVGAVPAAPIPWTNGPTAEFVFAQVSASPASALAGPYGVAIDATHGKLYVADNNHHRVLRYAYPVQSSTPTAELAFGQADLVGTSANRGGSTAANTLSGPTGIAVSSTGDLWVADAGNNRVLKYSAPYSAVSNGPNASVVLGQAASNVSASGTALTAMSNPYGVCLDGSGNLWVVDSSNSRVLRFNNAAAKTSGASADGVLGQTGVFSCTRNTLSSPMGVAASGTTLWVSDYNSSRVLRFDNAAAKADGANADGVLGQGNFTSSNPNRGGSMAANSLSSPAGIFVDVDGRLYVAENGNGRVLVFSDAAAKTDGADADNVLGSSSLTTASGATFGGATWSVAYDATSRRLIVGAVGSNRIYQFYNGYTTSTTLATSAARVTSGGAVTFTATVTTGGSGPVASGNVEFREGATVLGTVALDGSGHAAFTTSALTDGDHTIVAAFISSATHQGSISSSLVQKVGKYATSLVLTASANPSTAPNEVTFTATVTKPAEATLTPGGTVIFRNAGVSVATVTLVAGGPATWATSSLAAGSHAITAEYSGDAEFLGANASHTQTVLAEGTYSLLPLANAEQDTDTSTGTTTNFDGSYYGGQLYVGAYLDTAPDPDKTYQLVSAFKFDLHAVTRSVVSARLKLCVAYAIVTPSDSGSFNLKLHTSADDSWTDSPAAGTPATFDPAALATLAVSSAAAPDNTSPKTGDVFSIDVTAFVQAQYAGDKFASFVLDTDTTTADNYVGFYAKEASGSDVPKRAYLEVLTSAGPVFIGDSTLNVSTNAAATDIKGLLHVNAADVGSTLTWSQAGAPSHGTLAFSGSTASSGSADIAPGGTITYTPDPGFAGGDSFIVQVNDTIGTVTRTINVNVTPSAPGSPDLVIASDTGASSTDNITNAGSLVFSGTGAPSDSTVTMFLDYDASGTFNAGDPSTTGVANGDGAWTSGGLSTAALGSGTYNVYAYATSATGSLIGPNSTALSVTFDRTAPTTTVATTSLSADTGASLTDFITNTAGQTVSGTLSAALAGGEIVQVSLDNGVTWAAAAASVGVNTWSIAAQTLMAGNTLKVRVTDAAGNSGAILSQAYLLDTTALAVTSVGVPPNATYLAGQNLDFTVNWGEAMAVNTADGTPSIALTVGGSTWQATYLSGHLSTALVFRYTIQSGDLDSDGVIIGALTLNGGTITDMAGNIATLTLNSVGSTAAVLVDAVAPTVTGRTVPSNGTYKLGQSLDFSVTYSEAVTVTGTPAIGITLASGGPGSATYVGGTGTTTLTFRYTVAAGNLDADGIEAAAAITLGGGTIKDAIGNDAQVTTLGFGDTTGVLVDGIVPTVSTSNRQTPGIATTKATSVTYRVTFSEPVTGVDLADFALNKTLTADGTIASVSPVTGSETTVYDVEVNSVSGNGTLRLDLNAVGTGIADLATNAIATGYTGGQTYTIDTTAPTLGAIARQTPTTVNTSAATATWRVSFSEGVTGVEAGDFALTAPAGSGSTATGTIASVTGVAGSETMIYDVVVNVSGQGPARLDLKASGTGIADVAGNALADGGFTTGDFYLVGITNVFDTVSLLPGTTRVVQGSTRAKVAQRFTTGATAPLSLTTVAARLGSIAGTPVPVVSVYTDNADPVGGTLVATLTNPASLSANAMNLWTSTQLLTASTTYWLVFEDASAAGSYEIAHSAATTGGVGAWLTTYAYAHGVDFATNPQAGSLRIAIGATSTPVITSVLTDSGTYGTAFAGYTITATNMPTSFAATGLPTGLSLNAVTGAISGTPTQAGVFNVSLTGTNASGTGPASTWVLTIAKAPLTVTANDASRYVGYANPTFTVSYAGFRNGDTAAALTTAPTATTTATNASPVGTYPITPAGGVSSNYTFSYVAGTLTVTTEPPQTAQTITFAPLGNAVVGDMVTLSASASSGLPVSFALVSGPATLSGGAVTCTGIGVVTVRATQAGNGIFLAATPVEQSFTVGLPTPTVTTPTQVPAPAPGEDAVLTVPQASAGLTYQWQRNGEDLANATNPTLTLPDMQPPAAGLYTYTAGTTGGTAAVSEPVIVGVATEDKVTGTGELVGADIHHPNGNVYDQLILEGHGATFTAEPAQVTRMSYVDLSGDIVQVEFSGAGSLSLVMDDAGTPAPAANYNQPGVNYVRGNPGIVITGADETTNVSVISVGRINAVNQSLFRDDVTYDGVANIAFIAIQSANGQFGGVRTGNVEYFAAQGFTGVYAPGVTFHGPVNIGDIQAHDNAQPLLVVGSASNVRIAGGSLAQPNGQPIKVDGLTQVTFAPGQTSQGGALPVQTNQGVFQQGGVNVTDLIVVEP